MVLHFTPAAALSKSSKPARAIHASAPRVRGEAWSVRCGAPPTVHVAPTNSSCDTHEEQQACTCDTHISTKSTRRGTVSAVRNSSERPPRSPVSRYFAPAAPSHPLINAGAKWAFPFSHPLTPFCRQPHLVDGLPLPSKSFPRIATEFRRRVEVVTPRPDAPPEFSPHPRRKFGRPARRSPSGTRSARTSFAGRGCVAVPWFVLWLVARGGGGSAMAEGRRYAIAPQLGERTRPSS
jgi:hypothetical protein